MPSLVEFLKHVLPEHGYKCWFAAKKGERPQQGFTQSFEDLASVLLAIDARGWDAYFALSTFKKPGSREGHNVLTTKCFWADIEYGDVGHAKPSAYKSAEEAVEAVDSFCEKVQFPQPTVVYSGGGIHVYWLIGDSPVQPDVWKAAAKRLKARFKDFGLDADPARTGDICSVLRPISTFNWKIANAPRPVECFELMEDKLPLARLGTIDTVSPDRRQADAPLLEINKAAANVHTEIPSYAAISANSCRQLGAFRDCRGNIPEPLWYAGLGILAHSADGDALSQEWSNGHPSYSPAETSAKLSQARAAAGPTTCQRFKDLNPSGCVGCPFTVTSPIVLGRVKPAEPVVAPVVPIIEEAFPQLPEKFGMNAKYQLTCETRKEDGTIWHKPFTNYPIYLVEVRDGEVGRKQGLLFRQWEPTKGWYEFEISSKEFNSMGIWGTLADAGVMLLSEESRKVFSRYVAASYTMLTGRSKQMRYDQFGWKDNYEAFYVGNTLYKRGGVREPAAGGADCEHMAKAMQPAKGGSLAGWSRAANKIFIDGCEAQAFTVLAGFAALLMPFVSMPGEGGAVISLMSPTSGTGKTTALVAMSTIWGSLAGMGILKDDTRVAKFRTIATLGNLPVPYDEMRDRHTDIIVEFIQSFITGRDKKRGRIDGTVMPTTMPWCTILAASSNESMMDSMNAKKVDGMSSRIFEIEAKLPKHAVYSLGKELQDELTLHQGYAGPAYIDYLLQPGVLEFVKSELPRLVDLYTQRCQARTPDRFNIRLVAATAVAGHIVKHMGILDFSLERIIEWALNQISDNLKSIAQAFNAADVVGEVLRESLLTDCLVVNSMPRHNQPVMVIRTPTQKVNMRYETDRKRLYVATQFMRKKLVEIGVSFSAVQHELEEKGILLNRCRVTSLAGGTDLPGGKAPCWEIDMTVPAIGETAVKEVLPLEVKVV